MTNSYFYLLERIHQSNMTIKRTLFLLLIIGWHTATFAIERPTPIEFKHSKNPKITKYSKKKNWAALPKKKNKSHKTPKGYNNNQFTAEADVFFIHPSVSFSGYSTVPSNIDIAKKKWYNMLDHFILPVEASVFNGACKVYAPRYRQVNHNAFAYADTSEIGRMALEVAYSDIKAAFEYYLKKYHKDRPFIIAADEQGSYYAIRLIKEFIEDKPLKSKFIVAYLVGYPVFENTFKTIKPCDTTADCGCFLSWGAEKDLYNRLDSNQVDHLVCHNPINWSRANNTKVPSSRHLGAVNGHLRIFKGCFSTEIKRNQLRVDSGRWTRTKSLNRASLSGSWVYQYFYLDIRKNVENRVLTYLKGK